MASWATVTPAEFNLDANALKLLLYLDTALQHMIRISAGDDDGPAAQMMVAGNPLSAHPLRTVKLPD